MNTLPLIVAGATVVSLLVYRQLLRKVRTEGAQVDVSDFDLPELLITMLLCGLLALVSMMVFNHPKANAPIREEDVLPGVLPFLFLAVIPVGFLVLRRITAEPGPITPSRVLAGLRHVTEIFGLGVLPPWRAALLGLGLMLAAAPMIRLCLDLTQVFYPTGAEQPLVKLFRDMVLTGNHKGVLTVAFVGVICAPLIEEFLFRGYFYGTLKRYCGGLGSAVFTAALFAMVHTNLSSLPALFVLALCLTLAYEASGSLLVPIFLHAFFNLSELLLLYYTAGS